MKQFLAIFKNSFKIIVGDAFFLALHILGALGLLFVGSLPTFSFSKHILYMREQEQSVVLLLLCLTGAFALTKVISDDIRHGADSILMSRPISPTTVLLGKWTAVIAALLFMNLSLTLVYLWCSEIVFDSIKINQNSQLLCGGIIFSALLIGGLRNYFFRKPYIFFSNFCLTALILTVLVIKGFSKGWQYFDFAVYPSAIMISYAAIVMCSVLAIIAVKFNSAVVIGSSIALFLFGLISQYIISSLLGDGIIAQMINAIIPDWQIFWTLDQLTKEQVIPSSQYIHGAIQVIGQSIFYLTFAVWAYGNMELSNNEV